MRLSRRWSASLRHAAALVALAVAWMLFAPRAFGGQMTYVIVAGASMEPALHQGDLVLVRRAPSYQIGQVVAYDHPRVGPIIHRIIGTDGIHYVLQGDSNNWIDSYAPKATEVKGASWIVITGAGSLLASLRTPAGLALLSLLFGAILVSTFVAKPRGETEHNGGLGAVTRKTPSDGILFAVVVLGLGSLLLAIVSFTRPTTILAPGETLYQQTGAFAYRASAPPTVYSGGRLQTGDPVYDVLVPALDIAFDYQLISDEAAEAQGTVSLVLEVSEPNGWRRQLPLLSETPFQGSQAAAAGTVDLRTVRRMISLLEQATAVNRDAYWVDVIAEVNLAGVLGGHPFQASFRPRLPFALDDHQLYLRAGDSIDAASSDPTHPITEGSVPFVATEPATLTILGLDVSVSAARVLAVAGLLAFSSAVWALVLPVYRAQRSGRAARILSEYAAVLVTVTEPLPATHQGVIEVHDFDDLARLAERTGRTILHASVDGEHHFFLRDGEAVYHARVADSDEPVEA